MTQYDQHQSAPPPAYPGGQPAYGEPAYGQPGFQPQKTNTMAILGLVFAFVFSPLGIVFSAIGLKQIKERREGGRGLALTGLILSIVFVLIGILFVILAATVFSAAVEQASQDAATVSQDAAAPTAEPAADVDGVVAACEVIVPAVVNLEADLANVATPEDYAAVMTNLRTTMESAAAQTTDPTFVAHVQTLSADFQQAVDAVNAGEDPSALEGALTADGTQIDDDCAAAGYVQ